MLDKNNMENGRRNVWAITSEVLGYERRMENGLFLHLRYSVQFKF